MPVIRSRHRNQPKPGGEALYLRARSCHYTGINKQTPGRMHTNIRALRKRAPRLQHLRAIGTNPLQRGALVLKFEFPSHRYFPKLHKL